MQRYISRRCALNSIVGLAIDGVLAKLPFGIERNGSEQKSKMVAADQEFLVINRWVLTRKDVATSEVTPDVI